MTCLPPSPARQVLLRLCEPFVDPLSGKAWGKLDTRWGLSRRSAAAAHVPALATVIPAGVGRS